MQLVIIDGIKLMPCSPTFVTARDAIIAADQATTVERLLYDICIPSREGVNASAGDAIK
jgi:hypothetical protein